MEGSMMERLEDGYLKNQDLTAQVTEDEIWLRRRKKVMIIDDDLNYRLAISEILVDHGFNVTTAKDGEIGLNNLVHEAEKPDLILVDLMMPVKGGLEFRREQARMDQLSQIPVIFVTGHGLVDGELCLQKPFEAHEIIGLIKQYT